jgi:predicted CopG family antitoxin
MENMMSFGEVLEAIGKLSLEDQETLIEVLQRRLIERRREEIAKEIQEAQREFQTGQCRMVTPDELMAEIYRERFIELPCPGSL